ncbi:MAG: hypothetical protein ABIT38_04705 [Gemmatimonadaceae bacterium]
MKINGGNTGPLRPDRARDLQSQGDAKDVRGAPTPAQIEKLDRVEISDVGRAKSAKLDPTNANSAERLAQVRQRVLQGAYNADQVVGELAQRILDRGDL